MSIMKIPSFDDYYIDTAGNVYECETGTEVHVFIKNGRRCANLYRTVDGCRIRKSAYISRLMAEAYIPDYSDNVCIVHIDGDLLNDELSNLRCESKAIALRNRQCNSHPMVLDETTGELFSTYAEAARSVNGHRNGVYLCSIGIQSHHKGHVFRYRTKN